MHRLLRILLVFMLPTMGWAEDTGFFGPEDDPVTEIILRQALDIADMNEQEFRGQTKSPIERPEAFDEFDLLREMHRADPEATLSLIELIRQARETN